MFQRMPGALALRVGRVRTRPAMRTVPPSGSSRPPRHARSVDFPEPDGPTIATTSPRSTVSETPRNASVSSSPVWKNRSSRVRLDDRIDQRHVNESVRRRQTSTLSEPAGADNVMTRFGAVTPERIALDIVAYRLPGDRFDG